MSSLPPETDDPPRPIRWHVVSILADHCGICGSLLEVYPRNRYCRTCRRAYSAPPLDRSKEVTRG